MNDKLCDEYSIRAEINKTTKDRSNENSMTWKNIEVLVVLVLVLVAAEVVVVAAAAPVMVVVIVSAEVVAATM